jgi:hypothetical protein
VSGLGPEALTVSFQGTAIKVEADYFLRKQIGLGFV